MKARRDTLLLPLLFGGLAVALGPVARLLLDRGSPVTPGGTPGMLVWILAPAVLALVFRRLDPQTRGTHLFGVTGRTALVAALAAALAAAAMGLVIAVGLALGGLSFTPVSLPPATFIAAAVSTTLFAFLEESAWRGYLLPSLLGRARYPVVVAVSGLIWFAWHLPYLDQLNAALTSESVTTLAPRLFIGVLALQFLYAELFLRCRSVWPAFALHATTNLVAQLALLAGLKLTGSLAWLLSPSADGVLVIVLAAGIASWMYRRRVVRTSQPLPGARG